MAFSSNSCCSDTVEVVATCSCGVMMFKLLEPSSSSLSDSSKTDIAFLTGVLFAPKTFFLLRPKESGVLELLGLLFCVFSFCGFFALNEKLNGFTVSKLSCGGSGGKIVSSSGGRGGRAGSLGRGGGELLLRGTSGACSSGGGGGTAEKVALLGTGLKPPLGESLTDL